MSTGVPRPRLVIALAAAIIAIGSAALFIRMSRAPALAIAFYRLLYATAIVAPIALSRARHELAGLARRDIVVLAATGVVLALHFACWIASLAPSSPFATSVAASAVLVTLHPVLVAAATPWLLRERVPPGAWYGIFAALLGAAIVALADARAGTHRVIGDVLAFAGAVAAAAYFLAGRHLRARLSLFAYVGPVYGSATVALGAFALATSQSLAVASGREHVLFAAMALGPMILGHTVLNWALGYAPAWAVSTTVLAEPLVSASLVAMVLGEQPPIATIVGGTVVLIGVALTHSSTRRPAR